MKRVLCAVITLLIACCSLCCGCVPTAGWFTSSETLRGQLDGLASYLAAPENYVIEVIKCGQSVTDSDGAENKAVYRALYLFADSGVYYYELDFKTGGAAHYANGVLKNYYEQDGETVVTGSTYATEMAQTLIGIMQEELAKPVQDGQKGYHYAFFNYDFISYANKTDACFNGDDFTAFSADFHVYKETPVFRSYNLKLINADLTYGLSDNISNITPEDIAYRYSYFKEYGEW